MVQYWECWKTMHSLYVIWHRKDVCASDLKRAAVSFFTDLHRIWLECSALISFGWIIETYNYSSGLSQVVHRKNEHFNATRSLRLMKQWNKLWYKNGAIWWAFKLHSSKKKEKKRKARCGVIFIGGRKINWMKMHSTLTGTNLLTCTILVIGLLIFGLLIFRLHSGTDSFRLDYRLSMYSLA